MFGQPGDLAARVPGQFARQLTSYDYLDVGDTGYPMHPRPTRLPALFAERARRRYGWTLDPRQIELLSEVVQGMYVAIQQFSEPGDGVIVQTPIYPPFLSSVTNLGRKLLANPLRETRWGLRVLRSWRSRVRREFTPYTPRLPFEDVPWRVLCPEGGAQLRFLPGWSAGPAPLAPELAIR